MAIEFARTIALSFRFLISSAYWVATRQAIALALPLTNRGSPHLQCSHKMGIGSG